MQVTPRDRRQRAGQALIEPMPYATIAAACIPLLLQPQKWIHRRVHRVSFVDETRLQHRVSLDFTIPKAAGELQVGPDQLLLPVALVRKGRLRNFDLRDEGGVALPNLVLEQNQAIGYDAIKILCDDALRIAGVNAPLNSLLMQELGKIVTEDADAAHGALTNLRRGALPGDDEQSKVLQRAKFLRTLVSDLTNNFVLFVMLRGQPGERRVVKFGYEEPFEAQRATSRWRELGRRILEWGGFTPTTMALPATGIGVAESYHFEIEVPSGAIVDTATLSVVGESAIDTDRATVRAHLMTHRRRQARESIGTIELSIRAQSPLLAISCIVSLATTGLLVAGLLLHVTSARPAAEPATALLVALPALYAAYIIELPQHSLVQRVARGLRLRILGSAMSALVAAGTLTFESPPSWPVGWRAVAWFWLACVSGLFTFLAFVHWWKARGLERGQLGGMNDGATGSRTRRR